MISLTSVDLPLPETPVTHTNPPSGTFTLIPLRLFSLAPITSRQSVVFTLRGARAATI